MQYPHVQRSNEPVLTASTSKPMAPALRHEPHRSMEIENRLTDTRAPKVTRRFSTTCCLSSTATDRASPNSRNLAVLSRPTPAPATGTLCHTLTTSFQIGSDHAFPGRIEFQSCSPREHGQRPVHTARRPPNRRPVPAISALPILQIRSTGNSQTT